ncbi:phage baseplate plug family protein [Xenorhabdus budapestensis]|uniref:phage baseplate plug family protein n=1 Tax=Xenorhabdus budapestensis TaxID=290110 RepID=UPI003A86E1DD
MNLVEIPLRAENQQFDIQLGGINYRMRLQWRDCAGWVLDVMHPNSEPIVSGIPLVFGVDILEQHRYLGFNGKLVFYCSDPESETNREELGKNNRLYFITGVS